MEAYGVNAQGMNYADHMHVNALLCAAAVLIRLVQLLAPAFKAQAVKDLIPGFSKVAEELTDLLLRAPTGLAIDIEPLTRRATFDVIGRAGFGYDFKALHKAQQVLDTQSSASSGATSRASNGTGGRSKLDTSDEDYIDVVKYMAGVERLELVVAQVLQDRRAHGISADDKSLLSFMLAAQQADRSGFVTDSHIRDQLMTFMLAGSDTTATTLAFCLFELAQRPQVLSAVQQEIQQVLGDTPAGQVKPEMFQMLPLLTGCINESLRLYPAAPGLARRAMKAFHAGPHLIADKTLVVADLYNCHR
eukprot:gene7257-7470_t